MKIIGKGVDRGIYPTFIVEMERDELANLVGFYFGGSDGCPKFEPGMEVKISDMFRQLYALKSADKELAGVAKVLQSLATLLLVQIPLVPAAPEVAPKTDGLTVGAAR